MSHKKTARKVGIFFFSNFYQWKKVEIIKKNNSVNNKMYVTLQKKCQVKFGKFCMHYEICEMSQDIFA